MCNNVSRTRVTIAQPDPARPSPPAQPSPPVVSWGDFPSCRPVSDARGGQPRAEQGRDEMMTATRQGVDDPICKGYDWTSGCGRVATVTVATLIPCMIPSRPLIDLCERCWAAMGQTRHGCCERHYPDGSSSRDAAFVVVPGWAPTS